MANIKTVGQEKNTTKFKYNLHVAKNLQVDGDLTVVGKSIVSTLEDVVTDENMIILRSNATEQLPVDRYSGLIVTNYDAKKTSGGILFDNQGIAYLGDVTEIKTGEPPQSSNPKEYRFTDVKPLVVRDLKTTDDSEHQHLIYWDKKDLSIKAAPIQYVYDSENPSLTPYLSTDKILQIGTPSYEANGLQAINQTFLQSVFSLNASSLNYIPIWSYDDTNGYKLIPSNMKEEGGNIQLIETPTSTETNNTLATIGYIKTEIITCTTNSHLVQWNASNGTLTDSGFVIDGGYIKGTNTTISSGDAALLAPKGYVDEVYNKTVSEFAADTVEAITDTENDNPFLPILVNGVMSEMSLWEPRSGGY